ncbi:c-type cytochrome [Roseovarius ramblicola]|uniref:C-type cytochrome n=1 Tax=Roseovarius ramblicola TaxID=2022336 RepID=A0ABV5I188_9RHOB
MARTDLISACLRITLGVTLLLAVLWPLAARADDKRFRLAAPGALADSGLLDYLLPRFSLKTGVRIEVVAPEAGADAAFTTTEGREVFVGAGQTWRLRLDGGHPGAARFADWLTSEIGQRTVTSYEVDGAAPFSLPEVAATEDAAPEFEGDAERGARVAQAKCGRCHVVDPERRGGIGSTPSFPVLRTLSDWDTRFQSFYALNPHPAFTQVPGVTEGFASHLPPAIVPIEVSPGEIEAILAYVAGIAPADLGAPLQLQ